MTINKINVNGVDYDLDVLIDGSSISTIASNTATVALGAYRGKVFAGSTSTAADTAAKSVTVNDTLWNLAAGDLLLLTSTNTNTAANATFSVNNGDAKIVKYSGENIATPNLNKAGDSSSPLLYIYDGTNWVWLSGTLIRDNRVNSSEIEGLVLTSGGSNNDPVWKDLNDITAGNIIGTFSDNDASFFYRPTAGAVDIESGKAGNGAKIERIKGNSVKFNQLIQNSDLQNWNTREISLVSSDTTVTLTRNATGGAACIYKNIGIIGGHIYYLRFTAKGNAILSITKGASSNGNSKVTIDSEDFTSISALRTATAESNSLRLAVGGDATVTGASIEAKRTMSCIDLTAIFGAGNEPSSPEAFEAWLALNVGTQECYDYTEGEIRNNCMTGIETVGFNQLDEEWELGGYSTITGQKDNNTDRIRSKNAIPCLPDTDYYFKCPYKIFLYFYQADGTFISATGSGFMNSTFRTPSNAYLMTVRMASTYGTTYNNDICINISHSGSRNGEYEPYWKSITNIDIPHIYGKKNGEGSLVQVWPTGMPKVNDIADLLKIEDGAVVAKRNIGEQSVTGAIGDTISLVGCDTSETTFLCDSNIGTLLGGTLTLTAAANDVKVYYKLSTIETYTDLVYQGSSIFPDGIPVELPANYDADDYGTEKIIIPNNTQSAPPILDIKYGINAPDTIKNLPHNYVSVMGEQNFTETQKARARRNIGVTLYESKEAVSEGTALSLVTTGEKATWNAKLDEIEFNTTYNASTNKAATMSDIPSSLPANGGNAATVGGHTVGKDVPSSALFTDTTYVFNTAYNESTNKAATMADIPDVSNKENKVTIVSVASGTTTLTAAAGNYYVFADTVGTMAVTLPLITGATTVSGLVLNFTTGSSPNFTITAQGGATVSYYIDYSIDANKSYELNCLWNGTKWIVAYGKID